MEEDSSTTLMISRPLKSSLSVFGEREIDMETERETDTGDCYEKARGKGLTTVAARRE